MTVGVVVGNPKPKSRTFEAAVKVAELVTGSAPEYTLDLVDLGPELLDWASEPVRAEVSRVLDLDLVVIASPTYKASYTGLLKVFLDRFGGGSAGGTVAVPLMLGGDMRHSLAPEVFLKPVLTEIGFDCPTRGIFLLESSYSDPEQLGAALGPAPHQVAGLLRDRHRS